MRVKIPAVSLLSCLCELGQVTYIYHLFNGTDAHILRFRGEQMAKWYHVEIPICCLLCLEGSWHSWLFILHVTTLNSLSWPFPPVFSIIQHPVYLIAVFLTSHYFFLWFLVYFLFPTKSIHSTRAVLIFVLFPIDSPGPRTYSVRHREGNQEIFVEWMSNWTKVLWQYLSQNKYTGNIDCFFLFLLLLYKYMIPLVACTTIHRWRKKRKGFCSILTTQLIFSLNTGVCFSWHREEIWSEPCFNLALFDNVMYAGITLHRIYPKLLLRTS